MRFDKLKQYKPSILIDISRARIESPIKMGDLAKRYGISDRVVRDALNELRTIDHKPICGDNKGYYWPRYKTEWDSTAERLGSYVQKIQSAIDGGNAFYKEEDQETLF